MKNIRIKQWSMAVAAGTLLCMGSAHMRAQDDFHKSPQGVIKELDERLKPVETAAIDRWSATIQQNPENFLAHFHRAQAYLARSSGKGDVDAALADLAEAIRLNADFVDAHMVRAGVYVKLQQAGKAIEDCDAALRIDPKNAGAYAWRAQADMMKDEFDQAIADATKSIELAPGAMAHMCRGMAHGFKKEYDMAVADMDEAARLQPGFYKIFYGRAQIHDEKGDYAGAIADYTHALELYPMDDGSWNNLAWMRATCAEEQFRDGKKAVEYATKACVLQHWLDAASIDTLAAADAEAGDFENAVKHQLQAMELAKRATRTDTELAEMAKDFQSRLEFYKQKKPYHKTKP